MEESQSVSERLTPVEIKNRDFKRTVWGYSPKEVVDFLDATAKTWESVQLHEKNLLNRIESLQQKIQAWQRKEKELQEIRQKAENQAEKTIQQATQDAESYLSEVQNKAEGIRKRTEQWLEQVICEVHKTEEQRNDYVKSIRQMLDQHYALLDDTAPTELSQGLNDLLASQNNKS